MPHVVTEPCFGCKNTVCVTVCPVDCFREDEQCLWIEPDACIDCGACVPECPVDAIFEATKVPEKWKSYIALNREKSTTLPPITVQKEPLKPA
jgi:ferredoxin